MALIYHNGQSYAELTPVMLSDNTDINDPYYGSPEQYIATKRFDFVPPVFNLSPQTPQTQLEFDERILARQTSNIDELQLQHLLKLFRGYPADMVVGWLKRICSSCELKLESVRADLFVLVKQIDGFPYYHFDMKKRVQTKNGDLLVDKLCKDIYTLISVMEGEDMNSNDLKELISNRRVARSISTADENGQAPSGTPRTISIDNLASSDNTLYHRSGLTPNNSNIETGQTAFCASSQNNAQNSESDSLQETVAILQADFISMKQQYVANEGIRSEQLGLINDACSSVKNDVHELHEYVIKYLCELRLCVQRIESEKSSGVANLKSEIKTLRNNIKSCEENFDMASDSMTKKIDSLERLTQKLSKQKANGTRILSKTANRPLLSSPENVNSKSMSESVNKSLDNTVSSTKEKHVFSRSKSDSDIPSKPINFQIIIDDIGVYDPTRVSVCDKTVDEHNMSNPSHNNANGNPISPDSSFSDEHVVKNKPNDNNPCCHTNPIVEPINTIPVIVNEVSQIPASNIGMVNDTRHHDIDDDGFTQYIRRRTKHYFVGGFKSSLTEKSMLFYIKRTNPKIKVTHIQIFRNYKYDTASVKLNVEDNEFAVVLDDPYFWPRGLRCKTWVSRNKYKGDRHSQYRPSLESHGRQSYEKSRQRSSWHGDNDYEYRAYSTMTHDYNPYLCLENQ